MASCFPYSGSHPLFRGTRIIDSFFGRGKIQQKLHKAILIRKKQKHPPLPENKGNAVALLKSIPLSIGGPLA